MVFVGRRVCLGDKNRRQEAPKEDKIRHRRKKNENKREEAHRNIEKVHNSKNR